MKMRLPLRAKEAARLYWELSQRGAFCTGEKFPWRYERMSEEGLLTLSVLEARYDPRLLAVLIHLFRSPQKLDPVLFKECLRQTGALSVMAVISEFVLEFPVAIQVKEFCRFLMTGTQPVPTQLFYRGITPLGGRKMEEAIAKPPWAFKKWGFLAADPPLLKEALSTERRYLFDQDSRLEILRGFTKNQGRFRLRDYLKEIGFSISRQQALKDLRGVPWIRKTGVGRGSLYEAKPSKP